MNKKVMLFILAIVFAVSMYSWEEEVVLSSSNVDQFKSYSVFDDNIVWCNLTLTDSLYTFTLQGFDENLEYIWEEPLSILFTEYKPKEVQLEMNSAGIFLYWEETVSYETSSFIQKYDFSGNPLWGEDCIDLNINPIGYIQLQPDDNGGTYITATWPEPAILLYIDSDGIIDEAWLDPMVLGDYEKAVFSVDQEGGVAVLKTIMEGEDAGCWFQVVNNNGTMEYSNNGLFLSEEIYLPYKVIPLADDEYIFIWSDSVNVRGNKLLSTDELEYADEVYLGNESPAPYKVLAHDDCFFIVMLDHDNKAIITHKFNLDLGMLPVNHYVVYQNAISHIQIKDNDNLLFVENIYFEDYYVREFDANSISVTPDDGWFHFHNSSGNINAQFSGTDSGRCYIAYDRLSGSLSGKNIQIVDTDGELLFAEPGVFLNEEVDQDPFNAEIIVQADRTVFCWNAAHSDFNETCFKMQIVDDYGNPLLAQDQQIFIETERIGDFKVLYEEENRIIVYMNGRYQFFTPDNRIYCFNIEDLPYNEWDENGLLLTDTEQNIQPVCKGWSDDSYMIYYYSNQINGTLAQLISDGEAQFPANIQILPDYSRILSVSEDYITYLSGSDIMLIRLDGELNGMWTDHVWLASDSYYENISYEFVSPANNLVKYWVSYEAVPMQDPTCRLKKQIISPQGEKLLGNLSVQVMDNGDIPIYDFFYVDTEDIIGIVCGESEQCMIKYMSMYGEILSEDFITIPELDGIYVENIESRNGRLFVTYYDPDSYSQTAMMVFDLDGNYLNNIPQDGSYIYSYDYGDFEVCNDQVIYTWREKCCETNSNLGYYYNCIAQQVPMNTISSDEEVIQNSKFKIQNYPNPFNPTTNIRYELAKDAENVTLKIYNIKGQNVCSKELDEKARGEHVVSWNGEDVASGIYLYKITADDQMRTGKMILLK